MMLLQLVERAS